jgi:hypothetical protein
MEFFPLIARAAASRAVHEMEPEPAVVNGMTSGLAGGGRAGVGWVASLAGRVASGALKMDGI